MDRLWKRIKASVAAGHLLVATCPAASGDKDHADCVYTVVGARPGGETGDRLVQLRQWWVSGKNAGQWDWNHIPTAAEQLQLDHRAAAAAAARALDPGSEEDSGEEEVEASDEQGAGGQSEAAAASNSHRWLEKIRTVGRMTGRRAVGTAGATVWIELGALTDTFSRLLLVPTAPDWRAEHAPATIELRCPGGPEPDENDEDGMAPVEPVTSQGTMQSGVTSLNTQEMVDQMLGGLAGTAGQLPKVGVPLADGHQIYFASGYTLSTTRLGVFENSTKV